MNHSSVIQNMELWYFCPRLANAYSVNSFQWTIFANICIRNKEINCLVLLCYTNIKLYQYFATTKVYFFRVWVYFHNVNVNLPLSVILSAHT